MQHFEADLPMESKSPNPQNLGITLKTSTPYMFSCPVMLRSLVFSKSYISHTLCVRAVAYMFVFCVLDQMKKYLCLGPPKFTGETLNFFPGFLEKIYNFMHFERHFAKIIERIILPKSHALALLSCQPRVTVMSYFVYKIIRDF